MFYLDNDKNRTLHILQLPVESGERESIPIKQTWLPLVSCCRPLGTITWLPLVSCCRPRGTIRTLGALAQFNIPLY